MLRYKDSLKNDIETTEQKDSTLQFIWPQKKWPENMIDTNHSLHFCSFPDSGFAA